MPVVSSLESSAFKNWKSWRSTLASTIQSYNSACADLKSFCLQPAGRSGQLQEVEAVLRTIDTELSGLVTEEDVLRTARISLTAARNTPTALAPVNILPTETLASIFSVLQKDFYSCEDRAGVPPMIVCAGVSSYWRRVAVATSPLWAHIDITTTQSGYDYAALSLQRSNTLPFYLRIIETETSYDKMGEDDDLDLSITPAMASFLAQASSRIHTLSIQSWIHDTSSANDMLSLWLEHASPGLARTLHMKRFYDKRWVRFDPPLTWERVDLESIENVKAVLESINTLHLQDIFVPWGSAAYHGLVDLRLAFDNVLNHCISAEQLASILSSSPGLVTLKMRGLSVESTTDWSAESAIKLPCLEILHLDDMSFESWKALLTLMPLSSCPNVLSVGLQSDQLNELSHWIAPFLRDTRFKTLVFSGMGLGVTYDWALLLLEGIYVVDTLVIDYFSVINEEIWIRDEGEESMRRIRFSEECLKIFCSLCKQFDEICSPDLQLLVPLDGVQTICLRRRKSLEEISATHDPLEFSTLVAKLRSDHPDLVIYTVPHKGSTYRLACATMFD